jgi:hypothetical protein
MKISLAEHNIGFSQSYLQMGCPALGVSVAFLKQPTLLCEGLQTKKNSKKILKNKNH